MATTRFGLEGYGVRRTSFSPKPAAGTSSTGPITRFGLEGYGVRRTTFAPKPASSGGGTDALFESQPIINSYLGRMWNR